MTAQESYDKINEYVKKNPGASISGAAKTLGVNLSTYYFYKAKLKAEGKFSEQKPKRKYTRKKKPEMLTFTEPAPKKIAVIFGDINSVRDLMKEFGL